LIDQSGTKEHPMEQAQSPTRRSDDRQQAIIDAATRVFAERGFSGTTNREIAREAGISPGLIYWYFRDKDELFRAVVQRLFPVQTENMLTQGLDHLSLEELLSRVGHQFMNVLTHPDVLRMIRLVFSELIRFPDVFIEAGHVTGQRVIAPLAKQLDVRVQRGEIPPTNTWLAAQSFFGAHMGFVIRKHMYRSLDLQETSEQEMVDSIVRIHAAGLAAGSTPGTTRRIE
jgi:AcrR family transcriptional regulator